MMYSSAKELIANSKGLSSLPDTVTALNQTLDDPYSTIAETTEIISHDPVLAARLLRIVNSPYYKLPTPIDTISMAVNVIGTQQLRFLALTSAVIRQFSGISSKIISMDSFWKHSFTCAIIARNLAKKQRKFDNDHLFTAALLHDIGRLLLLKMVPEEFKQCVIEAKSNEIPMYVAEQNILGFDHAEVGAELLEYWNLPRILVEPIRHHHNVMANSEFSYECSMLHLADALANILQPTIHFTKQNLKIEPEVWKISGISEFQAHEVLSDVELELQDTMAALYITNVA